MAEKKLISQETILEYRFTGSVNYHVNQDREYIPDKKWSEGPTLDRAVTRTPPGLNGMGIGLWCKPFDLIKQKLYSGRQIEYREYKLERYLIGYKRHEVDLGHDHYNLLWLAGLDQEARLNSYTHHTLPYNEKTATFFVGIYKELFRLHHMAEFLQKVEPGRIIEEIFNGMKFFASEGEGICAESCAERAAIDWSGDGYCVSEASARELNQ